MIKLIRKSRRWAYDYAKYSGDVQAVLQGRIVDRVKRRILGRMSRKTQNKILPAPLRNRR